MRWVEVLWCGSLKDPTFAFYVGLSTPSLIRKRRSFPNTDLAKRCPRSRAAPTPAPHPSGGSRTGLGQAFCSGRFSLTSWASTVSWWASHVAPAVFVAASCVQVFPSKFQVHCE